MRNSIALSSFVKFGKQLEVFYDMLAGVDKLGALYDLPLEASAGDPHDVAAATGGALVGDDVDVAGASFDTRTLRRGNLFVPLVADRDGHRARHR